MNKNEILKDYVFFCNDLKLNTKQKTSKKKYIDVYMKNYIKYYGIKNFENTQKQLENIIY